MEQIKSKNRSALRFRADFKPNKDQVRRIGRLFGIRQWQVKKLLAQDIYIRVREKAELYNKVRRKLDLSHTDMRVFLIERKPYSLKEIAEALNIKIKSG